MILPFSNASQMEHDVNVSKQGNCLGKVCVVRNKDQIRVSNFLKSDLEIAADESTATGEGDAHISPPDVLARLQRCGA